MTVLDSLFVISAILGGGVFSIRTILMLLGVGDDPDLPAGTGAALPHTDADVGTRLLSIQGIAAFLMMFGLVGLALTREAGIGSLPAVALSFAAGIAGTWVVAKVMTVMLRLQSSGTLDLTHAVGEQGTVYLTVRPGAGGQVQVAIQGRLGIYEAQTDGVQEIPTGRGVLVVAVRANQLVVEPVPNP